MKNNNNSEYARLKSKIYARFLTLTVAAVIIIFALYKLIWQYRGGNFVLKFLVGLGVSRDSAEKIYQHFFRNFTQIIWIISVAVIFLVMLRFFMNWFTKYFTSINRGIDALLIEDDAEIKLPPEMAATENTLNTAKRTLRKRKREALEAERRKNDMITYLAHDIHTPLTSVIGYLSLLKENPDLPADKAGAYLGISLDKALQLENLINEFFEITKYNLQQITLNKNETDLYYLLLQLSDEFYPVLSRRGNTIELNADEDLSGRVDADRLARVFGNIIRNAAAYSYPNSVITIDARRIEGNIVVAFTSRGKTIPNEKLGSVFEKFFRADDARSSATGGAGLGLAIAKDIVELHGGTVCAESENEITTFKVTLPA